MKDIWQSFEVFYDAPLPIALAIIACIARQAHHGWQGLRVLVRELIICMFMGMVISWSLDYTVFSDSVRAAIISGGSFASVTLIDPLLKKAISMIENWHGRMKGGGE